MLCTCQDRSSVRPLIIDKLIAYQRQIPVCICPATFLFMNLAGCYIYKSCSIATVAADLECDSCMATALTTGVISVIITAFLVVVISVAVHCTVYQCVYKVKPRFISADRKPESGGGDAIVYDVVDERVGKTLEMKQNEAYGVAKSRDNN